MRSPIVSLVPALTVAAGLALAGCGLFGGDEPEDLTFSDATPTKVIKEQLTEAELLEICNELIEDGQTKAMKAQSRVADLQAQLAEKEATLEAMKAEDIKDDKKRAAAAKKWRAMEAEIESLSTQLESAEQERDQLRTELKQTLVELDKQIVETKKFKEKAKVYRRKAIHYKAESTRNLWTGFVSAAKVEICDRGSRRRHEKCHEAVESAFSSDIEARFVECVDTYQAEPVLRQLEKKEAMPAFAVSLADDNKFTKKGWIVLFCDPTLPEAGDKLLEEADPELDGPDELPPSRSDEDGDLNSDDELDF
jgi:hypothetical protein